MKTLSEIALRLKQQVARAKVRQEDLRVQSGISRQTLTNVLSGMADYRMTTLLSIADRLGLELVFVPKVAAPALEAGETRPPIVKTAVQAAQDRVMERVRLTAGAKAKGLTQSTALPFGHSTTRHLHRAEAGGAGIPPDFPSTPHLASLAGAQPKLAVRLVNGQYVVGLTPEELQARFDLCEDLVGQLVAYCRRKQAEHPGWSQEELLSKVADALRAKAAAGEEGWDLSEAERSWVLGKVRLRLGAPHKQSQK